MRNLIIDFTGVTDKASVHEAIKTGLELPDYYGKNLDALHDCLSELTDCMITLKNIDVLYTLDIIGVKILKVFEEAADTNNTILVVIE